MATMYIVKKNIESAGEMGPLAGSQVRELVQSGELTASDSIRNVNSQNWVRIDSVPQLASELSKPKSSPKNKDVDLEHPQQVQLNPDQAKGKGTYTMTHTLPWWASTAQSESRAP